VENNILDRRISQEGFVITDAHEHRSTFVSSLPANVYEFVAGNSTANHSIQPRGARSSNIASAYYSKSVRIREKLSGPPFPIWFLQSASAGQGMGLPGSKSSRSTRHAFQLISSERVLFQ
jgi:hypothetical protein